MKRNDLGLKIPARRGDCQEFCARKLDRSAGRGPDHDGMTSAQVVALTLDQANAQYCKKQRVDQRHRQDQREAEISRFAQRFRHLLKRDEQALPGTSPSALRQYFNPPTGGLQFRTGRLVRRTSTEKN